MPSTSTSDSTILKGPVRVQTSDAKPGEMAENGFTLIELLVVIALIALLIGILLPALKGARDSARNASTKSLLNQLASASAAFETENRRAPGYFTARDMGNTLNTGTSGRGMTGMENVLLDLSGKDAIIVGEKAMTDSGKDKGKYAEDVGPIAATSADAKVYVNPEVLSTGKNTYFNPGKNLTRFIMGTSPNSAQVGTGTDRQADGSVKYSLPTLIDANGQPILAWQLDESTRTPIALDAAGNTNSFVGNDSADPSRFYWGSNAAILRSKQQGKLMLDTVFDSGAPTNARWSLLSEVTTTAANHSNTGQWATLMALTGQPGAPNAVPNPITANVDQILPSAPRGKIIFHAPGSDGIFLAQGQGAKLFRTPTDRAIYYGIGMKDSSGGTYKGIDGKATSINFLDRFDDVVQAN